MHKIQKTSAHVLFVIRILGLALPAFILIKWCFIGLKIHDPCNLMSIFYNTFATPEGSIDLRSISWTPLTGLLGFGSDILAILPFGMSLVVLQSIFQNYQKGEVFSVMNAISYRRLGTLFLLNGLLIKSLSETLLVFAVTLNNAPGHRWLVVSYETANIMSLFYGFLVIIISWVMLEATKLYDEQTFTI